MDSVLAFAQRLPAPELIGLVVTVLGWLLLLATHGPKWLKLPLLAATVWYGWRLPQLLGYPMERGLMGVTLTLLVGGVVLLLFLPSE